MFEWINKPKYLWVFKDSICCLIEVIIVASILYALVIWWCNRK